MGSKASTGVVKWLVICQFTAGWAIFQSISSAVPIKASINEKHASLDTYRLAEVV